MVTGAYGPNVEAALDKIAAQAGNEETNPAVLAYGAIALWHAGRPEAATYYEQLARRATSTQRTILHEAYLVLAESHRPVNARSGAAALAQRSLLQQVTASPAPHLKTYVQGLVLEALGRAGEEVDHLRQEALVARRADGSFDNSPWITAYMLGGMFFTNAAPTEVARTREWLEKQAAGGWFRDSLGEVSDFGSTAICTLSLLWCGSGKSNDPCARSLAVLEKALPFQPTLTSIAVAVTALILAAERPLLRLDIASAQRVTLSHEHHHHATNIDQRTSVSITGSTIVRSNIGVGGPEHEAAPEGAAGEAAARSAVPSLVLDRTSLIRSSVGVILPRAPTVAPPGLAVPTTCSACEAPLSGVHPRFCWWCGAAVRSPS